MVRIKLSRDNQEYILDWNEIKEMSQALGDIKYLYDFCGNWFQCPDCHKKGADIRCGKRYNSGSIRSEPEPIVVEFTDGRIELFDSWEQIDVKEITSA